MSISCILAPLGSFDLRRNVSVACSNASPWAGAVCVSKGLASLEIKTAPESGRLRCTSQKTKSHSSPPLTESAVLSLLGTGWACRWLSGVLPMLTPQESQGAPALYHVPGKHLGERPGHHLLWRFAKPASDASHFLRERSWLTPRRLAHLLDNMAWNHLRP